MRRALRRRRAWRRLAQVWSMDIIIAVIIFLLAVSIFYVFTQKQTGGDQSRLRIESELVAQKLTGDRSVTVVTNNALDEARLNQLIEASRDDYNLLKAELGIRDDFCILLVDQRGNILLLGNDTDPFVGIGNGNLTFNISDALYGCGELYTGP